MAAKKPKGPLTAEQQLELDLQLENELSRLQRQHKILERDRGAYTSGAKLAKQKKVLTILRKEQTNVLTDLVVATCSTRKKQDEDVRQRLVNLLQENDEFDKQIVEKKNHLKEIDEQIDIVNKEVQTYRAKLITDVQYQAKVAGSQKTLEQLENKLETATKRFCVISTENRKLREEIQHMLIERINFNKMWERLIGNLNKGKSFMMDLIEQATIAYDQREEWLTKLQALRSRGHSDLLMHTQEMESLQRRLDHDGKLQGFLSVKGQRRVMKDLLDREMQKREKRREEMEKQLEVYKQLLADIMEFTQTDDLASLANKYIKQEEENFAIFNYIVKLNKEIEAYTEDLVDIHRNIEYQRALNHQREEQQAQTLAQLTAEMDQETKEADQMQSDLDTTNSKLQKLYAGITNLFTICKCSNAPFLELLGDNTSINDYNVLLYLEMLENRISELIVNVYYKQKSAAPPKKGAKAEPGVINEALTCRPVYAITSIVPTNPCPLCVEQENVQDVIDTLQFVQDNNIVKDKLAQRLALPDGLERLHNVSACHLPKSRQIIQKRYQ